MTDYYRLHVLLKPDNPQDALVIEALERLGDRGKSKWVRRMLYEAVTGPARSEILAEVQAVKLAVERLERNGLTVQDKPEQDEKEPNQAAENLDGLLDRLAEW